jgi:hypothetical protein
MHIANAYGNLDFYQSNITIAHFKKFKCPKSNKTLKILSAITNVGDLLLCLHHHGDAGRHVVES